MRGRSGSAAVAVVLGVGAGAGLAAFLASRRPMETGGDEPGDNDGEVVMSGTVRAKLGEYFEWSEVERTNTGIANKITTAAALRFQVLHDEILDPLRRRLGRAVNISSGYRGPAVNRAVGGAPDSRHLTGEAVDMWVSGLDNDAIAATIVAMDLPFDQIIWYSASQGNWVHAQVRVALPRRRQVLYSPSPGKYEPRTPRAALAIGGR